MEFFKKLIKYFTMGQNEKKADIHFIFGNVLNIHSKVIFSCRGHKNRLMCQISGHLVLLPRFQGCLKLKRGEKSEFFTPYLNWEFPKMVKDIEKRVLVPNNAIQGLYFDTRQSL